MFFKYEDHIHKYHLRIYDIEHRNGSKPILVLLNIMMMHLNAMTKDI